MPKWVLKQEEANIELMSQTLKISKAMAQALVNRGIRTKNTAIRFLNPSYTDLHDTLEMKDMQAGLDIVSKSITAGEKIVIYGDYDADGVMSTVILFKALSRLGADVFYYIPERVEEGYGLNMSAIQGISEMGVKLIVTCDNGIASKDEIASAKGLGMKVVVIDHHEPGFIEHDDGTRHDISPGADAVIDPKQSECGYPFKSLCAGGLAYKFAKALYAHMDEEFADEEEYLVFAMIATICDIVELHGENRVIVYEGLAALNRNKTVNIGLGALIEAKGYTQRQIDATAIGFIIGPCINASGRLEHARFAVDLFVSEDAKEVCEVAEWIVKLNDSRRGLTKDAFNSADSQLIESGIMDDNVLVVYDASIHESVAGIVAGRLKDKYYKPAIVITDGEECLKGSARSIEGYNIFEELYKNSDLFVRFGGHAMAAGLSIKRENLDELRKRLNADFSLTGDDLLPKIYYDGQLEVGDITYDLAKELLLLEPFGKDNRAPLFCSRGQTIQELRVIEGKNTIIMTFIPNGGYRKVKAVSFGAIEDLRQMLYQNLPEGEAAAIMAGEQRRTNLMFDLLYEIELDEYNGNVSVQMRIKDFAVSESL